jgi:hypothetical protein
VPSNVTTTFSSNISTNTSTTNVLRNTLPATVSSFQNISESFDNYSSKNFTYEQGQNGSDKYSDSFAKYNVIDKEEPKIAYFPTDDNYEKPRKNIVYMTDKTLQMGSNCFGNEIQTSEIHDTTTKTQQSIELDNKLRNWKGETNTGNININQYNQII